MQKNLTYYVSISAHLHVSITDICYASELGTLAKCAVGAGQRGRDFPREIVDGAGSLAAGDGD